MKYTSLALCLVGAALFGQQAPAGKPLSLEDELLALLNAPVEGASKRQQSAAFSPQAIEVLTGAELRQMGITRIQDALRLLTSVDLIEAGTGATALGMRGVMQDGQPRTVQILIDGAPMYNVEGGGVDIDILPVPVDLIDRIEVVRGPSSTLYGANAVAGVIAITTRKAEDGLHGNLRGSSATLGSNRGGALVQFGGGAFSATGAYDAASTHTSDQTVPLLGDPTSLTTYDKNHSDATHQSKALARLDGKFGDTGLWLAAGDARKLMGPESGFNYRLTENSYVQGGWRQNWSKDFATEVRFHRVDESMTFAPNPGLVDFFADPRFAGDYKWFDTRTTLLELQGNWTVNQDLHVVFGADSRKGEAFGPAKFIGLTKDVITDRASGGFLSVDWDITQSLALSAGARAENESLGGSRTSPRLALVWKAGGDRVFRAAYLTSTRSPQIAETQPQFRNSTGFTDPDSGLPVWYELQPNPALKPEKTVNVEVGYRDRFGAVSLDLTLFRMSLRNLIYQAALAPYPDFSNPENPVVVLPNQFLNGGNATDQGVEVAVNWLVASGWNLGANATYLDYKRDTPDPSNPLDGGVGFAYAPKFKANAFTRFRQGAWTGYASLQYVGATNVEALLQEGSPMFDKRDAYLQSNLTLGYEISPGLTLSAYARNGNRPFQPQGTTGFDRPEKYFSARREAGAMVRFVF